MKSISRRAFFKTGISLAGTVAASSVTASICGLGTAEQPLGPFFPNEGTPVDPIRESDGGPISAANDNDLSFIRGRTGTADGQLFELSGKIIDQNCEPVESASVVIWQASHTGWYNHRGDNDNKRFVHPVTGSVMERKHDSSFQYWGKDISASDGSYNFRSIVPGFYPANLNAKWYRPPHVHFLISAPGYKQLITQMYFKGDIKDDDFVQSLNQSDYLLQDENLSEAERDALVVQFTENQKGILTGSFDIQIQKLF
ncbi:MAG: hypothetical protein AB8E15_00880 [Bdellovibrionales bacterium]